MNNREKHFKTVNNPAVFTRLTKNPLDPEITFLEIVAEKSFETARAKIVIVAFSLPSGERRFYMIRRRELELDLHHETITFIRRHDSATFGLIRDLNDIPKSGWFSCQTGREVEPFSGMPESRAEIESWLSEKSGKRVVDPEARKGRLAEMKRRFQKSERVREKVMLKRTKLVFEGKNPYTGKELIDAPTPAEIRI